MTNQYYLSLGSNIEPESNIIACIRMLRKVCKITGLSQVYETKALGDLSQPDYLNAVVRCKSDLTPMQLQKKVIERIETNLGRTRSGDKFDARTIDIDIILVNRDILKIEHRPIPSPEILSRAFVAIPIAEIEPELRHPITDQSMLEISAGFANEAANMLARPDVLGEILKMEPLGS